MRTWEGAIQGKQIGLVGFSLEGVRWEMVQSRGENIVTNFVELEEDMDSIGFPHA